LDQAVSKPSGPLFVIGDIHGCATELELLLARLPLSSEATVVFLGDYVDRGNGSRAVIDTVLDLRRRHHVVALLGNHEAMFLDFCRAPKSIEGGMFIYNGGSTTLASYADPFGQYMIPPEHVAFLQSLLPFYETPEFFCVHAGLPEMPLEDIAPATHLEEMLWTRSMRSTQYRWSKVVVHGHEPTTEVELCPHRIGVDTGCVFGRKLSAVELPSRKTYSIALEQSEPPTYLRDIRSSRHAFRFEGSIPVSMDVSGHPIHFLTINYSEIGMLLRCLSYYTRIRLRLGEVLEGTIGVRPWQVKFTGEIVRAEERGDGACYAVKILNASGE
jgi:serine/threonine protein phosphatase 1